MAKRTSWDRNSSNNVSDGLYEMVDDRGVIRCIGEYKNKKRNGPWKFFDEQGRLWQETVYVDGERNGLRKVWHGDKLLLEEIFKNDKLSGCLLYV